VAADGVEYDRSFGGCRAQRPDAQRDAAGPEHHALRPAGLDRHDLHSPSSAPGPQPFSRLVS
jgi:hypothetical protein